ncbi:MAG: hypothetical protein ACFFAS_01620 [Promethearchaeota archaeon]
MTRKNKKWAFECRDEDIIPLKFVESPWNGKNYCNGVGNNGQAGNGGYK